MFQSVYNHWSQKRVQKTARALANRLGIPKRFLRAGINITQCFGERTEYSVFYDCDSAIEEKCGRPQRRRDRSILCGAE